MTTIQLVSALFQARIFLAAQTQIVENDHVSAPLAKSLRDVRAINPAPPVTSAFMSARITMEAAVHRKVFYQSVTSHPPPE